MSPLSKKIHTLMYTDPNGRPSYLGLFMSGLSMLYGAGLKIRAGAYKTGLLKSKKLPCRVISVGNITTGGTGKTPMTVYLARRIHQMGYRAAVISRGYRGRAEKSGGIVSNGREILMGPRLSGDEPFMMAAHLQTIEVPVLVGRDRYRIGLLALEKFNPDVIILDDGFQHIRLARDVNLVLLDSRRPFGNSFLLPRGVLREPVSSLGRADILILTRSDSGSGATAAKDLAVLDRYSKGHRLYKTIHRPVLFTWLKTGRPTTGADLAPDNSFSTYDFSFLKERKILAFSGIAKNDNFRQTLEDLGCDVTGFLGFPDHHAYADTEFVKIFESAANSGADCLCTTDKDYARMESRTTWPLDLAVIGVEISFGDEGTEFDACIKSRLERSKV